MTVRVDESATWPLGDMLPLRRSVVGDLWPELGLLRRGSLTVYLTDAFLPGLFSRLLYCDRITYDSAEAILADGWVAD